jgi:hypothetical protein
MIGFLVLLAIIQGLFWKFRWSFNKRIKART